MTVEIPPPTLDQLLSETTLAAKDFFDNRLANLRDPRPGQKVTSLRDALPGGPLMPGNALVDIDRVVTFNYRAARDRLRASPLPRLYLELAVLILFEQERGYKDVDQSYATALAKTLLSKAKGLQHERSLRYQEGTGCLIIFPGLSDRITGLRLRNLLDATAASLLIEDKLRAYSLQ
ncbi:MAG: hypothetical protein UW69_C0040G0004 [Microgenomates group bacterium GW2011_GWA2_44_7]|nr:MAG: hypothetical protein UW69_C0040G0004 [Microgenomates group bacterium GW2011_GWA2_44_7]